MLSEIGLYWRMKKIVSFLRWRRGKRHWPRTVNIDPGLTVKKKLGFFSKDTPRAQNDGDRAADTITRRVFCIGMNKTGTSTMNHCFKLLNLTPVASPTSYSPEVRKQIRHFYKHKDYNQMLDLAKNYKAFEDRPWNMWTMYRHLHTRFPDSLFILTIRDPESWWRSTERWITVTKPEVLARYQLHLRVHQPSKESMTDSYLRYNREVEAYFADTGQLLLMDIEQGDGWEKLCGFLDVPIPEEAFPHANRQKYTPEDAQMLKKKKLLKHGLECQACHNLTLVKKAELAGAGRKSGQIKAFYRAVVPAGIARRPRSTRAERLQNSPTARKILYGAHRAVQFMKSLSRNRFNAGNRRFESALPADELAVVSCFFNPGGSARRVSNFKAFLSSIKQSGVRCLVIELAFGSNPFDIVDHDDVIQLRTNDVLWHKERLLNIGIRRLLSDGVRKIAWLDGDIVFDDPEWPLEIASRLEKSNLCQVFETVGIHTHNSGHPIVAESAVKRFQDSGELYAQAPRRGWNLLSGVAKGGQSGFGWAARAEVLEKALLFERAIVGGGDKLIFIASLAQDMSDERFKSLTHSKFACDACGHRNKSQAYEDNFHEWAGQWSSAVGGAVDYARLHISDMYHGQRSDRGYSTRHDILYRNKYDPATDLTGEHSHCFEWSPGKEQLRREVEAYFLSRREDV